MGNIVAKAVVKRKPGMLYYVDGSGNVGEAKMKTGGTRGHKTCSTAKPKKKAAKKAAPKKSAKKAAPKKRAVKKAAHKHHHKKKVAKRGR